MKHGSLFSGIGGFDLAAQWMGWENVFHCEWNLFGQKVLKHYWPNAISYYDITKSDFTIHRGTIDILTGGFPCQPFSTAGKREGTADDRYLWPEMLRAIREIEPRYIVGENVRGLVNWNGGMVFDTVCANLEAEGYEIFPVLLPAASVNAPHRRDRIWFVAKDTKRNGCILGEPKKAGATNGQFRNIGTGNSDGVCGAKMAGTIAHSNNKGGSDGLGQVKSTDGKVSQWHNDDKFGNPNQFDATDTKSTGLQTRIERQKEKQFGRANECYRAEKWHRFPTISPICARNDGLSDRLDGITFPKWRNESIKGAGNAIVPQVAYQIFKTIEEYERFFH